MNSAPSPVLTIRGNAVALFASDMHLSDDQPATADLFFSRLADASAELTHLFLLGDLFEAWVGDDDPSPVGKRLNHCIRQLVDGGRTVYLMRGNRDFLLDCPLPSDQQASLAKPSGFSCASGASLLEDPCLIDLFGCPTLLSHGDALCTDDAQYQAFRTQSRDPAWQQAFLQHPLVQRQAIARNMRAHSETEKGSKAEYLMDVNQGAVATALLQAGATRLIHGHTHRPACHRCGPEQAFERWVLPDWDAQHGRGGLLRIDASGPRCLGDWGMQPGAPVTD